MPVKKGNKVKVDYQGTLDDGTEFDNSEKHGKPLEFEAGAGQVIVGFDKAVIGMEKGQKKNIKITSEEGYGECRPELVKTVPRAMLPSEQELNEGMMIAIGTPDGYKIPALIIKVTDTELTLDLNHPLAGKNLNFKVTLVDYS